jgi:hypothetical protein
LDDVADRLEQVAARPGVRAQAPPGALPAVVARDHPNMKAQQGGFYGLSSGARVGLIVLLVLAVLLLPVTVLLVLLAMLVIALVLWVKHLRKAAA